MRFAPATVDAALLPDLRRVTCVDGVGDGARTVSDTAESDDSVEFECMLTDRACGTLDVVDGRRILEREPESVSMLVVRARDTRVELSDGVTVDRMLDARETRVDVVDGA